MTLDPLSLLPKLRPTKVAPFTAFTLRQKSFEKRAVLVLAEKWQVPLGQITAFDLKHYQSLILQELQKGNYPLLGKVLATPAPINAKPDPQSDAFIKDLECFCRKLLKVRLKQLGHENVSITPIGFDGAPLPLGECSCPTLTKRLSFLTGAPSSPLFAYHVQSYTQSHKDQPPTLIMDCRALFMPPDFNSDDPTVSHMLSVATFGKSLQLF